MERLARGFGRGRFRAVLALLIGLAVGVAASGLLRLEFDDNHRKFFRGSSDAYEQLERLAGIFPLSGFWSKDEILASISYDAGHGGGGVATLVLVVAIIGAFITAFYMARLLFLTFFGSFRGGEEAEHHLHESPPWPIN